MERKWYQGTIDRQTHAMMKAAVAMNYNNIEEFINAAITEKLSSDGFLTLYEKDRKIAAVK